MSFCVRAVLSATLMTSCFKVAKFNQLDLIIKYHALTCFSCVWSGCFQMSRQIKVLLSPWLAVLSGIDDKPQLYSAHILLLPPISRLGWVCRRSICKYLYTAVHQSVATQRTFHAQLTREVVFDWWKILGGKTVAPNEIQILKFKSVFDTNRLGGYA